MKFSKIVFSLIGVLLIVAGIFLYMNFGGLAKNMAEKIASNALGVKVTLSSLSVSLKEKKATIRGIKIDNPPGFKNAHIITADEMLIGLNTASRQLIDFNDIQVNGTVVNLEVTQKGTNLNALKDLASEKKQKQSIGSKQIRVIVRKMVINESTINPSVTLLNRDIGSIKLPAVRVSGIGQNSKGTLAQDAVSQVLLEYLRAAQSQVQREGLLQNSEEVMDTIKESVDDVKNNLKNLFD